MRTSKAPSAANCRLDDTWLKASALGCMWAAMEIVLGGFLHNLRIPGAGNIMAALGIVLMVAVGQQWPVRGLFWRAGLVCALMKGLAPTAVIFGPMIAITCQACLMELSVRLLRRNPMAYALGSMLAMSWNMAQFVINKLIAYGDRAIDVYVALVGWSEKNLGLPTGQTWLPVLLILAVQLTSGLAAGLLGIFIGRRAVNKPLEMSSLSTAQVLSIRSSRPHPFSYSLIWLGTDLFLLATLLILTGLSTWVIWMPVGLAAMAVWIWRYRDAVRPLLRPGFWVCFLVLTALSGALFGSMKAGWNGVLTGLGIGLAMNFRAAVLVIGFSALGTEIRSPRLGRGLARGRLGQLPAALEAAVETLPLVMANLPKLDEIFRRPVTVFHQVLAQADFWLKRLALGQARRRGVLLLCGQVGEGKSRALRVLADGLRADGRTVVGILSPSVHRDGQRIGYDLIDVASGRRTELSRVGDQAKLPGYPSVGHYTFRPEGIRLGQEALSKAAAAKADVVLVDEVGPWELRDQGWAGALYELTLETRTPMIWVVRADIVEQVRIHWSLHDPCIIDLLTRSTEDLRTQVREWLEKEHMRAPCPH